MVPLCFSMLIVAPKYCVAPRISWGSIGSYCGVGTGCPNLAQDLLCHTACTGTPILDIGPEPCSTSPQSRSLQQRQNQDPGPTGIRPLTILYLAVSKLLREVSAVLLDTHHAAIDFQ